MVIGQLLNVKSMHSELDGILNLLFHSIPVRKLSPSQHSERNKIPDPFILINLCFKLEPLKG